MLNLSFSRLAKPGGPFAGLPFAGSSLDMDFSAGLAWQNGSPVSLAGLLTTTRASAAAADDNAGNWSQFATNIPRITNKGLLVEEARTNSVRNNSMQGAVAGTPGTIPTGWNPPFTNLTGLTLSIAAVGSENGIDYIDFQITGTPSSAGAYYFYLDGTNTIAATVGQVFTHSLFFKKVTDDANISQFHIGSNERNGTNNSVGITEVAFVPTSLLARYSNTFTMAQATCAFNLPYIKLSLAAVVPMTFRFRIGWPQVELGAFVTSPIRTTSVAVTRAADAVTLTNFASLGFNVNEGTLLASKMQVGAAAGSFPGGPAIDTVSAPDLAAIGFFVNGTTGVSAGVVRSGAGATIFGPTLVGVNPLSLHKLAMVYKVNDFAGCGDGGTLITQATGAVPTGFDRLLLSNVDNYMNGYLSRVAYWPTRLSNAQLQAITR